MELFHLLGQRGSTRVLSRLEEHAKTFSMLKEETGLERDLLVRRLKGLTSFGFVSSRAAVFKNRRTHEYFLTENAGPILQFMKAQESLAVRAKVKQEPQSRINGWAEQNLPKQRSH